MIFTFYASFLFIIVFFVLTFVIVSLNSLVVEINYDISKKAPYECGFQPFDNDIQQFDIKYYLVSLLFLIFDVETIFIIPYITVMSWSNSFIFCNILLFLFLLFLGLFYEWKNNFLDWE